MVKPIDEEAILTVCLRKGLVTPAELETLNVEAGQEASSTPTTPYGVKIQRLLDAGKITSAQIDALLGGATESEDYVTSPFLYASASSESSPMFCTHPSDGFLKSWTRFQVTGWIGEGGMGRVYKAVDPQLGRPVAIKLLKEDDPLLLTRLMREAKLQAKIAHENVGAVYEAGYVEGKPYIAMQFIAGKPLHIAAKEMNVEEKIGVMRRVAQAVHAAHAMGIVHRDIKPGNILVEKTEEGFHPWVLDFGLARDVAAPGLTASGLIQGTPQYMSPEQIKGDFNQLDRRADVYSMGATLYEILTGHPPFEGDTTVKILMKVLHEEAPPIRKLMPRLPADLETIVMKCLEKEPQRRYESAKALAQDLERYLQGDPITARRTGLVYKTWKRAKKHKVAVAIGSAVLMAGLLLGGAGLKAQWSASRMQRLAQEFGQEVEKVETRMRLAYMAQPHDIRRDQKDVMLRMERIREKMEEVGKAGQAPGNYALGRGYMALHQIGKAYEHLHKAWEMGYRTPEASYALGVAMGELYVEKYTELERKGFSGDVHSRKVDELQEQWAEPALKMLRETDSHSMESPLYGEALIAFYGREHKQAAARARRAFEQTPWLYEAKMLEAKAVMILALADMMRSEYPKAQALYDQAGEALKAALELGKSDDRLYITECEREGWLLQLDYYQGKDFEPHFSKAMEACDKAAAINPENVRIKERKLSACFKQAEYLQAQGKDPESAIRQAVETGEELLRTQPGNDSVLNNLGNALWTLALHQAGTGRNPLETFQKAVQKYEKAIAVNPNCWTAYTNLLGIYGDWGLYQLHHGEDPTPNLTKVTSLLGKPSHFTEDDWMKVSHLGNAYAYLALFKSRRGEIPESDLKEARKFYGLAIKLRPNDAELWGQGAFSFFIQAQYEFEAGRDPAAPVHEAVVRYQKAVEINSGYAKAYAGMAQAGLVGIRWAMLKNQDPTKDLTKVEKLIGSALAKFPDDAEVLLAAGETGVVKARQALSQGLPPGMSLNSAEMHLKKSQGLAPHKPETYLGLAGLYRWRAEWKSRLDQNVGGEVRAGLAMAEKALSINVGLAQANVIKGALHCLAARGSRDETEQGNASRRALENFAEAAEQNPLFQCGCEFTPATRPGCY